MKAVLAFAALAGTASAHSLVAFFHVNGVPENSCVNIVHSDASPVTDLSSSQVGACAGAAHAG